MKAIDWIVLMPCLQKPVFHSREFSMNKRIQQQMVAEVKKKTSKTEVCKHSRFIFSYSTVIGLIVTPVTIYCVQIYAFPVFTFWGSTKSF